MQASETQDLFFFFPLEDWVSLCIPECPGTYCIYQDGLEPAFASRVSIKGLYHFLRLEIQYLAQGKTKYQRQTHSTVDWCPRARYLTSVGLTSETAAGDK